MKIKPISSGSEGNCIIVEDSAGALMLDAGVSFPKMRKSYTGVSAIDGALISHEHGDHIKGVPELIRRGVPIFASFGTAKHFGKFGATIIEDKRQYQTPNYHFMGFNVQHDAEQPFGYIFESKAGEGKGVYMIDFASVPYNFSGVTHWLIECNHGEDELERSDDPEKLKARIRQNHFSYENLTSYLQSADLSRTREIWLLHLSDRNSDEQRFKQGVQAATGVPTFLT